MCSECNIYDEYDYDINGSNVAYGDGAGLWTELMTRVIV